MARKYFAVPREAFSFWDDCRKETVSTPAVSMTFLKKEKRKSAALPGTDASTPLSWVPRGNL
jgi:hypothetical protein